MQSIARVTISARAFTPNIITIMIHVHIVISEYTERKYVSQDCRNPVVHILTSCGGIFIQIGYLYHLPNEHPLHLPLPMLELYLTTQLRKDNFLACNTNRRVSEWRVIPHPHRSMFTLSNLC